MNNFGLLQLHVFTNRTEITPIAPL